MLKAKMCFILMLSLSLFGCGGATMPIKNQVSPVSGVSVTYVYPNVPSISDLSLISYTDTKNFGQGIIENRGVNFKINANEILVKGFIDNGQSGSVNEYRVKYSLSGNTITLTPFENRQNQDGLVLPKPIPILTPTQLVQYLSNSKHKFSLEVDSKYPTESVNANFKRLTSSQSTKQFSSASEKIFKNTYFLSLESAEVKIDVNTYPYREGSKCTISVDYITAPNSSNIINIKDVEEKIRAKLIEIVNA